MNTSVVSTVALTVMLLGSVGGSAKRSDNEVVKEFWSSLWGFDPDVSDCYLYGSILTSSSYMDLAEDCNQRYIADCYEAVDVISKACVDNPLELQVGIANILSPSNTLEKFFRELDECEVKRPNILGEGLQSAFENNAKFLGTDEMRIIGDKTIGKTFIEPYIIFNRRKISKIPLKVLKLATALGAASSEYPTRTLIKEAWNEYTYLMDSIELKSAQCNMAVNSSMSLELLVNFYAPLKPLYEVAQNAKFDSSVIDSIRALINPNFDYFRRSEIEAITNKYKSNDFLDAVSVAAEGCRQRGNVCGYGTSRLIRVMGSENEKSDGHVFKQLMSTKNLRQLDIERMLECPTLVSHIVQLASELKTLEETKAIADLSSILDHSWDSFGLFRIQSVGAILKDRRTMKAESALANAVKFSTHSNSAVNDDYLQLVEASARFYGPFLDAFLSMANAVARLSNTEKKHLEGSVTNDPSTVKAAMKTLRDALRTGKGEDFTLHRNQRTIGLYIRYD